MTEAEWLACEDPTPMLAFRWDKATEQQVLLLGAACCRRFWHLLSDRRCQVAVETVERYAVGAASVPELWDAEDEARAADVSRTMGAVETSALASLPEDWVVGRAVAVFDMAAALASFSPDGDRSHEAWAARQLAERACQADLARDIFGNPYRRVKIAESLRPRQVVSLAQAAYEERTLPSGHLDNARLAVLSDALEEAGCTDEALLAHLRSPGPHVRGCWAVDLVLGKK